MKFLNANKKKIKSDVSEVDEILEQEEILYVISECLVGYRKNNGLSQEELAKKLNVNQTMVSKLESGKYNPTFIKMHEISRKLTDSSEIFIQILENIIKSIKRVTEKNYVVEKINIKPKQYTYSKIDNVIKFEKIYCNYDIKNGEENYGGYQSKISAIG